MNMSIRRENLPSSETPRPSVEQSTRRARRDSSEAIKILDDAILKKEGGDLSDIARKMDQIAKKKAK